MAEGKKKILIYADWMSTFESLSDDEAGRLIKHFFRYINDLNPESDRLTELMFVPIKQTLKRDLEKYMQTCLKNSENGSKGGRPKKTEDNPNKPNGFLENPTKAKKADSDRDSDIDINKTIPSVEVFIAYGLEKMPDVSIDVLRLKYDSWIENGWCTNRDGKKSVIKNWKSTLINTLPYLQKQPNQPKHDKLVAEALRQQEMYKNL